MIARRLLPWLGLALVGCELLAGIGDRSAGPADGSGSSGAGPAGSGGAAAGNLGRDAGGVAGTIGSGGTNAATDGAAQGGHQADGGTSDAGDAGNAGDAGIGADGGRQTGGVGADGSAGGLACGGSTCAPGRACTRIGVPHCYDPSWAEWPMPNSLTTVELPEGGTVTLPNPKSYDASSIQGVVIDNVTGLQWQQAVDPGMFTWTAAHLYCDGLQLAGGGWRLPTRIELTSIVDSTRSAPAINPVFVGTPSASFWTASPEEDGGAFAWFVYFGTGYTSWDVYVTTAIRVRCVR